MSRPIRCSFYCTRLCRPLVLIAIVLTVTQLRAAGSLFVLENHAQNYTVNDFSTSGADLGTYADASGAGLIGPIYIAFDSSNNLYVEDYAFPGGNQVHKFGPNGADLGTFAKKNLNGPEGIAFDANGMLYVANNNDGNILKFDQNGKLIGTFANVPDALGIAFDASGDLYVANSSSIHKLSPSGSDLGLVANGLFSCNNVAVDKNGNVYASLTSDGQIREYSSSGVPLGLFASIFSPGYLAFDPNGNLFVADTAGDSIREFSPTGQYLGVFASTYPGVPASFAFSSVPEPSTIALFSLGSLGLLLAPTGYGSTVTCWGTFRRSG